MDILRQTRRRRYVYLIAGLLGEHADAVRHKIDWHTDWLFFWMCLNLIWIMPA